MIPDSPTSLTSASVDSPSSTTTTNPVRPNKCSQIKRILVQDPGNRCSPNDYIWHKVESLIERMMSEEDGVPVRNVKSLMSTIPSTFTGNDVVQWMMQHVDASDVSEAVNLASRIAAMGYLFCIDDHSLQVKNDSHTYYRFQTPFLYPSRCMEADTVDYAVYLCKRTMQNKQRLELAGFEAERLASLQTLYCHKWEFVYIQAEAEAKVDKKRDKLERLVLDSQERAYWDVHRPPPGCVNTTDVDMRKLCRAKRPKKIPFRPADFPIPTGPRGSPLFCALEGVPLLEAIGKLNTALRPKIKSSKAIESLQNFCDQYSEYDLLLLSTTSAASSVLNPATGQPTGGTTGATSSTTGQITRTSSPANHFLSSLGKGLGSDKMGTTTSSGRSGSGGSGGGTGLLGFAPSYRTGSAPNNGAAQVNPPTSAAVTSTNIPGSSVTGSSLGHMLGSANGGSTGVFDSNAAYEPVSTLNPWISDNPDYWIAETRPKYLPARRIKRWGFSIHELLKDPIGLDEFQRWLEKEFSAENLRFWQACQDLKGAPLKEIRQKVLSIYNQYLSPNAADPLNVNSRIAESIRCQLSDPNSKTALDRYCFAEAESHIFHLMNSDSYYRFLRSDYYRELFSGGKKKSKKIRAGVGLTSTVGTTGTSITSSQFCGGVSLMITSGLD